MTLQMFNTEKATAALLYVLKRIQESDNKYKVLKVLYFAEKAFLADWARPMIGDDYVAMQHGPVPSKLYDMVKQNSDKIGVDGNTVTALAEADMDCLSKNEIQALDDAIERYAGLSFSELKKQSHDKAYDNVGMNDEMSLLEIAKAGGADQGTLDLLGSNLEMYQ